MTLLDKLIAQGVRAYREPRDAAADVLAVGFPREALAPSLFLVVSVSVVLNRLGEYISPSPYANVSPFQMAFFMTAMMVVFSYTMTKAGNWLGGHGKFPDALLLMIFLQAIFLPAVVAQMLLYLVMPVLAALFILAVMVLLTWVHLSFIAALHGFDSLWRAFGVLVIGILLTVVALTLIVPFFMTLPDGAANV